MINNCQKDVKCEHLKLYYAGGNRLNHTSGCRKIDAIP